LNTIHAITFDFWGTLYQSIVTNNTNRTKVLQEAILEAGLPAIPEEKIIIAIKKTWKGWVHIWENEQRTWGASEWLVSMQNLLEIEFPENMIPGIIQDLEHVVLDGNTKPINGVLEMIPSLAKEYRLGIISDTGVSSGRTLCKLLEKDGILKYFSSLVFSDEVGKSKPANLPYKKALEALSASPKQAVHVGDLRRTDVAGAANFGMWSIRFTGYQDDPREEFGEATVILADYKDMQNALDHIDHLARQTE